MKKNGDQIQHGHKSVYVANMMMLYDAVQEIQHVCKCAVQRNSYQLSVSAR